MMLERIERVTRVKGTELDIGRSFKRKEGYEEEKGKKQDFSKMLQKEMQKEVRPDNDGGPGVPRAYALTLNSKPTHSLYYDMQVDIAKARELIYGNR